MYDPQDSTGMKMRQRAHDLRGRLDSLCGEFERRTSGAYRLRGHESGDLCGHMRRFWRVRDRLRLNLHAADSCPPERAHRVRERLDQDWRRAQELVGSPRVSRGASLRW